MTRLQDFQLQMLWCAFVFAVSVWAHKHGIQEAVFSGIGAYFSLPWIAFLSLTACGVMSIIILCFLWLIVKGGD